MSNIRGNIIDAEWSHCLNCLRDARALILRNAESFHQAAMALERVGQTLCGKVRNGLGAYENELLELSEAADDLDPSELKRLFETVRDARNMAVHEGAWARHLSSRLVELFLIMEQAITDKMRCAHDIMVRQPMIAEPWHQIAHVRQAMLVNSFSSFPILLNDRWHVVSDLMIMRYLRDVPDKKTHKLRLSNQLEAAIQDQGIIPEEVKCFAPATKLNDLISSMERGPALITEDGSGGSRLVGLLTPFDLL